jgi:hypothetical protein
MVKTAKKYGAHYVLYAGLTLYGDAPDDCKTLYYNFLNDKLSRYLIRSMKNLFKGSVALFKTLSNGLGP